jgi:hypothetical protein
LSCRVETRDIKRINKDINKDRRYMADIWSENFQNKCKDWELNMWIFLLIYACQREIKYFKIHFGSIKTSVEASCYSTAPMYLLHKDGWNTICGRNTRKAFFTLNIVNMNYALTAQQQTNHQNSCDNIMKINTQTKQILIE